MATGCDRCRQWPCECEPCRECGGEGQVLIPLPAGPTDLEPVYGVERCPRCRGDMVEPCAEELEGHPEPGGYDYERLQREERGDAFERMMDEKREPR